jgi:hypothetical protein
VAGAGALAEAACGASIIIATVSGATAGGSFTARLASTRPTTARAWT